MPPEHGAPAFGLSDAHIGAQEPIYGQGEVFEGAELLRIRSKARAGRPTRGQRGVIREFSRGSRKRMLDLLNSVDRRGPAPLFVTLTYPGQDWEGYAVETHRHLQNFRRWVMRLCPGCAVVWKLEPQPRGAPHYHLLVFGVSFIHYQVIADTWWRIVGSGQLTHLMAGTQIRPYLSWREKCGYMSKYIAKEVLSSSDCALWLSPGRFWGVWGRQRLPVVRTAYVLTRQGVVKALRVMRGLAHSVGYRMRTRESGSLYISSGTGHRIMAFAGGLRL